jgi:membrane-associated phospholipid phosphatase
MSTQDQGTGRLLPYLPIVCCCAALLLTFIRLIEFDAPLTRFVRSLNDVHIDHLHNPWLAEFSDVGNQLGKGESLLVVSAVCLAAGYGFRRAGLRRAGWETLIAHVVAGGLNTALKHLVGRARPKFMHTGDSEFSPFGGSGWDSFPSGHAMAAFAVATVLAVRYPRIRWLVMVLALAVSASRLFRGSHFLTDIVAGAVLGTLVGVVVANPWTDRRSSFTAALMTVTPPVAGLLAVITSIGQRPAESRMAALLHQAGLLTALTAMLGYLLVRVRPTVLPGQVTRMGAVALMGLGVAMCSGSFWVATVILLLCIAYWLRVDDGLPAAEPGAASAWPSEAAFGLAVLLTLFTIIELRGVLPMG